MLRACAVSAARARVVKRVNPYEKPYARTRGALHRACFGLMSGDRNCPALPRTFTVPVIAPADEPVGQNKRPAFEAAFAASDPPEGVEKFYICSFLFVW